MATDPKDPQQMFSAEELMKLDEAMMIQEQGKRKVWLHDYDLLLKWATLARANAQILRGILNGALKVFVDGEEVKVRLDVHSLPPELHHMTALRAIVEAQRRPDEEAKG